MDYEWMFLAFLWTTTYAFNIDLLECKPPDEPIWGGYGPKQDSYSPGDIIHYYCPSDSYMGGNYLRICEDTGEWTGETPVCDAATAFSSVSQSSTRDERSGADMTTDGDRSTCSSTVGGRREEWLGTFYEPGELIRVMLFLPKGPASYDVVLFKPNGEEVICGSQTTNIDRHWWTFHNCPGPANLGASGVKIRSKSNDPLRICEIQAHVLTSPKCPDPRVHVDSGHVQIDRKSAVLVCDEGFVKGRNSEKLVCVRDGVWSGNRLYCTDKKTEPFDPKVADVRKPANPDREIERIRHRGTTPKPN